MTGARLALRSSTMTTTKDEHYRMAVDRLASGARGLGGGRVAQRARLETFLGSRAVTRHQSLEARSPMDDEAVPRLHTSDGARIATDATRS